MAEMPFKTVKSLKTHLLKLVKRGLNRRTGVVRRTDRHQETRQMLDEMLLVFRAARIALGERGVTQGGTAGGGHPSKGGCTAAGGEKVGSLPSGESGERVADRAENAVAGGGGSGLRFGVRADATAGNAGGTGGETESGA